MASRTAQSASLLQSLWQISYTGFAPKNGAGKRFNPDVKT